MIEKTTGGFWPSRRRTSFSSWISTRGGYYVELAFRFGLALSFSDFQNIKGSASAGPFFIVSGRG